MKRFYNPFAAHVSFKDGTWKIRRFGAFGWEYLDRDDDYWWNLGYGRRWTSMSSEDDVVARLRRFVDSRRVITIKDVESP